MPKLPSLTARGITKALKKLGYYKDRQKGSHATFRHEETGRSVTVPVHKGRELKRGTLSGIIRDLGVSHEEFLKVL